MYSVIYETSTTIAAHATSVRRELFDDNGDKTLYNGLECVLTSQKFLFQIDFN
jgi:hypothetical protein